MTEWILANLGLVLVALVCVVWFVPGIIFGIAGSVEKSRKRQFGLRPEGGAFVDHLVGWALALLLGPIAIVFWAASLVRKRNPT